MKSIDFNYNYPQLARDAGFRLRQYKDGPLDWHMTGSLEVERILRDQRYEQIDNILGHLAEVPLGTMLETNILDSGISKYFILSQFSIQYLLFCRKFLDETITELRESYAESQVELAKAKKALTEANNEILQLHKKVTQMEAIHEVIYPCHFCTKNFVSNEALNIHIARKHAERTADQQRTQTPMSLQKERDNDLTLINTIKLELEIKQLKERLNVAEKEIRERSTLSSKRVTPREQQLQQQAEVKQIRNVGIQSNLIETKEKDDEHDNGSELSERKEQITKLEEKIHNFEEWKEKQIVNNEESIAEIHRKLSVIAETVEKSKLEHDVSGENSVMQQQQQTSVENLECLLTQKLSEIGKANAEKLEEAVQHIELNYKEKLSELEKEIRRKSAQQEVTFIPKETKKDASDKLKPAIAKRAINTVTSVRQEKPDKDLPLKSNNDTYEIEELSSGVKHIEIDVEHLLAQKNKKENMSAKREHNKNPLASLSTESNRTFIKANESAEQHKDAVAAKTSTDSLNESTDVSESLSSETETETSAEEQISNKQQRELLERPATASTSNKLKTGAVAKEETRLVEEKPQLEKKEISPRKSAKQLTRKDAKKIVNKELARHELDLKTKSISKAIMKRVNNALNEERAILKQSDPNFSTKRNNIKKFVDKLCSKKLPDNAKELLKTKPPLQPFEKVKVKTHYVNTTTTPEDSFDEHEPEQSSTPIQTSATDNDAFKKRLERILGSQRDYPTQYRNANPKVLAHRMIEQVVPQKLQPVPVPLPRKRVMFNTNSLLEMNAATPHAASKFNDPYAAPRR